MDTTQDTQHKLTLAHEGTELTIVVSRDAPGERPKTVRIKMQTQEVCVITEIPLGDDEVLVALRKFFQDVSTAIPVLTSPESISPRFRVTL